MSIGEVKTWLVAYDIADPRRLRRVHRQVRRAGASVQYSAYSVPARQQELDALLASLGLCIDGAADDVRAYHLPARCRVWTLGLQGLPEGVEVDADTAARWLLETAQSDTAPDLREADHA
jgi:CRISPR-associated protein Cas2